MTTLILYLKKNRINFPRSLINLYGKLWKKYNHTSIHYFKLTENNYYYDNTQK